MNATGYNGELMFLFKWEGIEDDFILANEAYVKSSEVFIKFYEKRFKWKAPGDNF